MKQVLQFFKIRRHERWPALAIWLYVTILNVLIILRYHDKFTAVSDHYASLFTETFRLSGFDPITYTVLSHWGTYYNIYRHPLLAFMMWIPSRINQAVIALTGVNGAIFVAAAIMIICGVYAFIFLVRLLREVVHLGQRESLLLGALTYGYAYTMVTYCVPDHFGMSMPILIFTLYVAGLKMQSGGRLTIWQTVVLFFITAGISLNNGIKTLLAQLFVNGRAFWRPRNLLLACLVPCALIWGVARLEWHIFEAPAQQARQEAKVRKVEQDRLLITQRFRDTTSITDPQAQEVALKRLFRTLAYNKYKRDHQQPWNKHTGKPIAKGEFSGWTDVTTPRMASLIDNWMGESVQLHQDYLLEDTLRSRPVHVPYRWAWSYVVEALLFLLFAGGVWMGRRSRFLWLCLSWMGFDLLLHIGLGFGINEVYIMAAHWLFILTIGIAFAIRESRGRWRMGLVTTVALLTLWLYGYNGWLLFDYLIR